MQPRTVAEVLASNARAFRLLRGLEQATLAELMSRAFGHSWRQSTVSEVEKGRRAITVAELLALATVLGVTVERLLDPRGPERLAGPELALATDGGYPVTAAEVQRLLCSSERLPYFESDPEKWSVWFEQEKKRRASE
jgi:transcriptional regulator with XRE-family HTH domain